MLPNPDTLLLRLDDIVSKYVPQKDDFERPTGAEKESLGMAIIFAHAEAEVFIEQLALKGLEASISRFQETGLIDARIHCLLASGANSDEAFCAYIPTGSIDKLIARFSSKYQSFVGSSHGIREHNIYKLFMPLGFSITDFSLTAIQNLDSFGVLRGRIAHNRVREVENLSFNDTRDKIRKVGNSIKDIYFVIFREYYLRY